MTKEEWLELGFKNGVIEENNNICYCFHNYFFLWLEHKKQLIKPQSICRLLSTYNRYILNSDFDKMNIVLIDDFTIVLFINTLLSIYSVDRKRFVELKQIIKETIFYCYDTKRDFAPKIHFDYINRNIHIKDIKVSIKEEMVLSNDNINKLYNSVVYRYIHNNKQCICYCVLLSLFTGLRLGEISALTWNDIDLEKRIINVNKTDVKYYDNDNNKMVYITQNECKTVSSIRSVPICDIAYDLILMIKRYHIAHGYNVPNIVYNGNECIRVYALIREFKKLCKLNNIPVNNYHILRKTFATYCHCRGLPIKYISTILGHSDIATTDKYYIKQTDGQYKEMVMLLNNVFKSPKNIEDTSD